MKKSYIYLIAIMLALMGCMSEKKKDANFQLSKTFFMGDSICIFGEPDTNVLSLFIHNDVDYTYVLNNMVSMSLILEPPAIYHCFFLEQVGTDKQIYYLKIDDAIKYNWIPPYDSLPYDLSLDFTKTELAGCSLFSSLTGKTITYKPDIPLKWSSMYEHISSIRCNSVEYYNIVAQCNDANELADYYNNSLFFQNNSFVSDDNKNDLLSRLISITQIQYLEYFFDFERNFDDILFPIILGHFHCSNYSIYEINDFNLFKEKLMRLPEYLNNSFFTYENEEHSTNKPVSRLRSLYLLKMNKNNLNNIILNIDSIENFYNLSSMMFCHYRPHHDVRLFFFNIKYDENNKITIEKNYYNKEYITTTRIRGYY